ncbi:MAG: hypothetical protein FWG87_12295 [Defluviitaleaceae bacterium]|nr:hypothetical protein [Defluviitaleaceae bacterium]
MNSIFLLLLVSPMMVLCLPIVIILDLVMSDGYLGFIMAMLAGVLLAFLGMWAGMTFRRGKDIAESS